ncbi:MAG: hypothetical protein H6581_21235 [Bacteroidia bacterium]|nr:hypothetical protein [Bacteroidia bacterium]
MKFLKSFLPLICLICLLSTRTQAQTQVINPDEDYGFMDYKLGESPESMPELRADGKYQKMKRYRPANDSIVFNGIAVKNIRLFFFQGQCHSLIVKTFEGESTEAMLAYFQKRYGEGEKQDAMGTQFLWRGEKCQVFYEKNLVMNDGQFHFTSIPVHRKYENYQYQLKYGDQKE